jgi:DNA-directed RNA polymerase subunit RPC12/RpoP
VKYRQRKSLQQLRDEAMRSVSSDGTPAPWSCRRCGCQATRVVKTWPLESGAIRRKRVCLNCGQDFTHTTEVPCPTGFRVVVEDEEEDRERACA